MRPSRALRRGTPALRNLVVRHEHRLLVRALRGAWLGLQLAPLIASGPAMGRVVAAGALFGAGRRRPMTLSLTAPKGDVPFTVPDQAALLVFREVFIAREYALTAVEPPSTILDMVKIDVGGAEFDVMPASRRLPATRLVVGEIHAAQRSQASAALLATLDGFDVTTNDADDGWTVFQAIRGPHVHG